MNYTQTLIFGSMKKIEKYFQANILEPLGNEFFVF